MAASDRQPLPDPVAEATRIGEAAAEHGLPLRVLGGVAVAILCPSSRRPPLRREYADIDLATTGSARDGVVELMESLGYAGDREFNMLHGHRRLFFWDEAQSAPGGRLRRRGEPLSPDRSQAPDRARSADRFARRPDGVEAAGRGDQRKGLPRHLRDLRRPRPQRRREWGQSARTSPDSVRRDWGLWRTLGMVAERSEQFALDLPEFDQPRSLSPSGCDACDRSWTASPRRGGGSCGHGSGRGSGGTRFPKRFIKNGHVTSLDSLACVKGLTNRLERGQA